MVDPGMKADFPTSRKRNVMLKFFNYGSDFYEVCPISRTADFCSNIHLAAEVETRTSDVLKGAQEA